MLKQQNKLETRDRRGCGWRCRICWPTGSSRSGRSLTHPWRNIRRNWGCSKSALQKYEAGTGNPTLATVQTIADHLHESPAQLLGMYSEEEMEAAGLMFRTLEWSMGLSEGSRRELAVLFRELSRFLSGELGGAPGTPKERKEER